LDIENKLQTQVQLISLAAIEFFQKANLKFLVEGMQDILSAYFEDNEIAFYLKPELVGIKSDALGGSNLIKRSTQSAIHPNFEIISQILPELKNKPTGFRGNLVLSKKLGGGFKDFLFVPIREAGYVLITGEDSGSLKALDLEFLQSIIVISEKAIEMVSLKLKTEEAVVRDSLTNFYNRHKLNFDLLQLDKTNLNYAILDLDKFKNVNDTYGHLMGDKVLSRLRDVYLTARPITIGFLEAYRYGGEEFVILSNLDFRKFLNILQDMQEIISNIMFITDEGIEFKVSFSAGAGKFEEVTTMLELAELCDKRLYMAKEAGRKRICMGEGKFI